MTDYSLIIPIYRNAENIPSLLEALEKLDAGLDGNLEVVFVLDGSPDDSGLLLERAHKRYPSKLVFHSRNFGSFTAIRTGMEYASGRYIAAMAADLQEPPELIVTFFSILSSGSADVVFGQRVSRNDPLATRVLSDFFWNFYRRLVLPAMPKGGVDIFACNRQVAETILAIEEPNSSLVVQLFWVGFNRAFVPYSRIKRAHGKSAWSIGRRFRYMLDSVLSFSDFPIMVTLWAGFIGCVFSLFLAVLTLVARGLGYISVSGYTTLVLLVLAFGSINLAVQGILGCYLWRAVENTKRRPLRIVSRIVEGGGS